MVFTYLRGSLALQPQLPDVVSYAEDLFVCKRMNQARTGEGRGLGELRVSGRWW